MDTELKRLDLNSDFDNDDDERCKKQNELVWQTAEKLFPVVLVMDAINHTAEQRVPADHPIRKLQ